MQARRVRQHGSAVKSSVGERYTACGQPQSNSGFAACDFSEGSHAGSKGLIRKKCRGFGEARVAKMPDRSRFSGAVVLTTQTWETPRRLAISAGRASPSPAVRDQLDIIPAQRIRAHQAGFTEAARLDAVGRRHGSDGFGFSIAFVGISSQRDFDSNCRGWVPHRKAQRWCVRDNMLFPLTLRIHT